MTSTYEIGIPNITNVIYSPIIYDWKYLENNFPFGRVTFHKYYPIIYNRNLIRCYPKLIGLHGCMRVCMSVCVRIQIELVIYHVA